MKAARKNSPIAQSRLALMYATGRGIKADPVEAARWHLIAQAGGNNDQFLDDFVRKMKPADRAAAEDKAKPWIARMKAIGPTPFPEPAQAIARKALTDVAASGHLPRRTSIRRTRVSEIPWPRSAAATSGPAW